VAGWQALRHDVLHGWQHVHIADAEQRHEAPRLGHRTIAMTVMDMHKRKKGREQGREAAALSLIRFKVRAKLTAWKMKHLADSDTVVEAVANWLRLSGLSCTEENIRAGLESAAGVPRIVGAANRWGND
jgi:hypothetical protein